MAIHRDEDVLMKSSSGGAFTALVDAFSDGDECFICAATYDEDLVVVHEILGSSSIEKSKFHGSKYVQSYLGNSLKQIKKILDVDEKLVFVGTPCQVAGLRNFLGKSYDNLLLIDFLCTGAGSPKAFDIVLSYLQEKRNSKIADYRMRNKEIQYDGQYRVMEHEILYSNGLIENRNFYKNLYKKLYYKHKFYRSCCYNCTYKSPNRVGDITIGDWWGSVEGLDSCYRGASVLICNNIKKEFISKLEIHMKMKKIELAEVIEQQPALREHELMDGNRKFIDISGKDEGWIKRYIIKSSLPTVSEILKLCAKKIIPKEIVEVLRLKRR